MQPEAVAVASALQFPEGPLILPGGEIGFCEIRRGTLSKIGKDGVVQVVAEVGGGPNGAARTDGRRSPVKAKCPRWFVPSCISKPSAVAR